LVKPEQWAQKVIKEIRAYQEVQKVIKETQGKRDLKVIKEI
jgi:hypothetical protein